MNIFTAILLMFVLAAAISFFIAFIIQVIFFFITKMKEVKPKELPEPEEIVHVQKKAAMPVKQGEIMAAISLALKLYLDEQHDIEKTTLTINRTVKPYSPWSSKIYGVRQFIKN
ncbi:MAG TPA: hypothetical protein VHO28_10380 [Ignavibacteriales bacterium]|jgi:hypothetical protein|nr:hypothetical protein [Ignavibacteriales bacterium]